MARMWRGPTAELKKAEADPLWAAIHRRAGRLNVFCDAEHDGRTAKFFKLEKRSDGWYRIELDTVRGADPMLTALWGAHRFTPLDAELLQLHHTYLERLAEEIAHDGGSVVLKLGQAVDQFLS
jgi:hypothetical protein